MYVRYQFGRFFLGLCLLALAPFQVAQAQSTDRISAAEFGRLWGPALDPAGATQVRNFPSGPSYPVTAGPSITSEAGGGLAVTKSARFPVDPSRVINVTAKAAISKAAMGKAFKGAFALAGGPLGLGLFAASEIVDWMNSSQLRDDPALPGFQLQMADPAVCSVAPCTEYGYIWSSSWVVVGTLSKVGAAVAARYASRGEACAGQVVTVKSISTSLVTIRCASGMELSHTVFSSTVAPSPTAWITPTQDQIETAASTPNMKPEWLQKLLESGVPVDSSDASLTGPASVSGPSTTSTKQLKDAAGNVTGTQTVNQSTTYNITYNGNTYNVNSVTTTTTVNPDGTSTVETKNDSHPTEKDTATDCDKFPYSAGCVSLGSATADTLNKQTQAVAVVAATFASASGCPSPLSFSVRSLSYSFSYQPLCDRLALLKVLFLAIAGVLAAYILADSFRVQ